MSKTQRWEWAIGLDLELLNDDHLHAAYRLNWDNLCKFDSCRKNCKRILCLACFDKSWVENDNVNSSIEENFDTTNCEQKREDLKTFVGLKNLGATCYVNCLLQLWFHNPALRKAIYEWKGYNDDEGQVVGILGNDRQNMISNDDVNGNQEKSKKISNKRSLEDDDAPSSQSKCLVKSPEKETPALTSTTGTNSNELVVSQSSDTNPSDDHSANRLVKSNPIEQLQLIFAQLQFTNKKSIDPFNFIDSLALNAAEQQDAQEFGNLFFEFLEKSFANQSNSFVSKIIQSQFCGRYIYATTCDHCKHSSLSESKFYDLHLNIQDVETLHDSLNKFFEPSPLDGKYNCSHCQKAQKAHRTTILQSLPPTLNLQLMRFVFDKSMKVRQKLNSYIMFPEILDMSAYLGCSNVSQQESRRNQLSPIRNSSMNSRHDSSSIYVLSAVLIHRGSSPHSGHYIAHIKDRITKDWFKFNDDCVERIGPQLQVSTDGESISIVEDKTEYIKRIDVVTGKCLRMESKSLKSKTAYMLVYQALNNEALTYPSDRSERWQLPDHLQTAVAEENSRCDEIFESLQMAREVDLQIIEARKTQVKMIYKKLVCRDPKEKFEFMDKKWLQNWLTNSSTSAKFPPIDNSKYLCIHDKLDFRKIDQVKCVRSEGADLLYKEFGGEVRLQDAMCRECVKLEVQLIQLKERMKEDQKFITSRAKFKLDASYDFADAYIVGKNSYRDWQALVMVPFKRSYPELTRRKDESESKNSQNESDEDVKRDASSNGKDDDDSESESDDEAIEKFVFNSDILCEHNQLVNDTSAWRIVPKEVWDIFKHYFGNDPMRPLIEHNANTIMCPDCKMQQIEQQEIGDIQKRRALEQKSKLPDLFHNRKRASWCSMVPNDIFYALDKAFLNKWQKFVRNPSSQEPPGDICHKGKLVCEHEKSLYNCTNSNPLMTDCPFVLISPEELVNLTQYYHIDFTVSFSVDNQFVEDKIKTYVNDSAKSKCKKNLSDIGGDQNQPSTSGVDKDPAKLVASLKLNDMEAIEDLDLNEIDWSDCIMSEPPYCSECHEEMEKDKLNQMLNYETATIYVNKVENISQAGGKNSDSQKDCDKEGHNEINNVATSSVGSEKYHPNGESGNDESNMIEDSPFKRRNKMYLKDEANDFVPPSVARQSSVSAPSSNSTPRRTTRRNRNRQQAYTIKPSQTLLELKKEIFARCQVLPMDQRLFLNDILLDDNSKTMVQLRIVPNCSLKLEIDKPVGDIIDLIEDEPSSRKSCAQPETGFKGSRLLSNSRP